MRISIALCTYNGEKYLPDQLASYVKQTRLPDELIVCDDGSTDRTVALIEQFAAQAPFAVQLRVNEKNLGSTKNFEQALQFCQGEIIMPSDQDDVWNTDKLRQFETAFQTKPQVGLIFSDANVVDENLKPLGYRLWQSIKFTSREQKRVHKGDTLSVLMKHNIATGAAMAFRAEFKTLFMPIPEIWVHDGWITFMMAMAADILPLAEPLIQYRKHGHNQVGTPGTSLLAKVGYALTQVQDQQHRIYEQYCILQKRVESQFPERHEVLHQIGEQIVHRQIRSQLPDNRLRRLPIILREYLTGRYQLFSSGYRGAAKDFLV